MTKPDPRYLEFYIGNLTEDDNKIIRELAREFGWDNPVMFFRAVNVHMKHLSQWQRAKIMSNIYIYLDELFPNAAKQHTLGKRKFPQQVMAIFADQGLPYLQSILNQMRFEDLYMNGYDSVHYLGTTPKGFMTMLGLPCDPNVAINEDGHYNTFRRENPPYKLHPFAIEQIADALAAVNGNGWFVLEYESVREKALAISLFTKGGKQSYDVILSPRNPEKVMWTRLVKKGNVTQTLQSYSFSNLLGNTTYSLFVDKDDPENTISPNGGYSSWSMQTEPFVRKCSQDPEWDVIYASNFLTSNNLVKLHPKANHGKALECIDNVREYCRFYDQDHTYIDRKPPKLLSIHMFNEFHCQVGRRGISIEDTLVWRNDRIICFPEEMFITQQYVRSMRTNGPVDRSINDVGLLCINGKLAPPPNEHGPVRTNQIYRIYKPVLSIDLQFDDNDEAVGHTTTRRGYENDVEVTSYSRE